MTTPLRHLILVLGDQLNHDASALTDFDAQQDAVWMAEVDEESTHVKSAKQRTTLFLSAMRHFAADLRQKKWRLLYTTIDAHDNVGTLAGELDKAIATTQPTKLIMTAPVIGVCCRAYVLSRARMTCRLKFVMTHISSALFATSQNMRLAVSNCVWSFFTENFGTKPAS